MHAIRQNQSAGQQPVLGAKTTVYFFRPPDTIPVMNSAMDDKDRDLSTIGVLQSRFIGDFLSLCDVPVELFVAAATKRAWHATREARLRYKNASAWHRCEGAALHGPARMEDFRTLVAIEQEIQLRRAGNFPPAESDNLLWEKAKPILEQFKKETREIIASIPEIGKMRSMVIVCDPVAEVASALFPHIVQRELPKLGYCDCLKVTADGYQHHVPLRIPRHD